MKGRIWKVRWNLAWKIMAKAKSKCSSNKDILLYKLYNVGIGGGWGVPVRKGVETWGTSRQNLKQAHNRQLFITFEAHWVIMIIFYKRNWSQCFFPWSLALPRQGPHLAWKNSASVLGNHCPTPTKPSAFQPVSSLEIIIAGWISITRKWEQWKIWDKSVRNACLRAYEDQCTGV